MLEPVDVSQVAAAREAHPDQAATPHWTNDPANLVKAVLVQAIALSAAGVAIWWGQDRRIVDFVALGPADMLIGLAAAGAMIGLMVTILWIFPQFLAWASDQQKFLFAGGRAYSWPQIFLISWAAGIGEEAFFRGGLQTWLTDLSTTWAAILLVSVAFTLVHPNRLGVLAFIFSYSIGFGLLFAATGSLLACMISHALFDIWAIGVVQRELKRQGAVR